MKKDDDRNSIANVCSVAAGARFGSWVVLHVDGQYAECVCDCGVRRRVYKPDLKRGKSKRCVKCNGAAVARRMSKGDAAKKLNRVYCRWIAIRNDCCREWKEFANYERFVVDSRLEHGDILLRFDANREWGPENVEVVKRSELNAKRKGLRKTSVFKGVCWLKQFGKWRAYLHVNGKQYWQHFDDEIDAAIWYDNALVEHNVDGAKNFPDEGERSALVD